LHWSLGRKSVATIKLTTLGREELLDDGPKTASRIGAGHVARGEGVSGVEKSFDDGHGSKLAVVGEQGGQAVKGRGIHITHRLSIL